jgi:hypothetical protein
MLGAFPAMNPKNGGKLELKLHQATSEGAEYEAELQTPAGVFRATASVAAAGGAVSFGAWHVGRSDNLDNPPQWLVDGARAALKAACRASQAEGRWPRRIARWRPEPSD